MIYRKILQNFGTVHNRDPAKFLSLHLVVQIETMRTLIQGTFTIKGGSI